MVTSATTAAAAAATARVEAERLLSLMLGEGKVGHQAHMVPQEHHRTGATLLVEDEVEVVPQEQHQDGATLLGGDEVVMAREGEQREIVRRRQRRPRRPRRRGDA